MPRFALEYFNDAEISRVYLAARLVETKRVEKILDANGIDYAIEVEPYKVVLVIIGFGEYKGAAFYVLSGQREFCRRILAEAGLTSGLLKDDEPE